MAIAKRIAKTIIPAPLIHPPEVRPPVIFNALILQFWFALMTMGAAQEAVIQSMITTANPFAVTLSLKREKSAMAIAP